MAPPTVPDDAAPSEVRPAGLAQPAAEIPGTTAKAKKPKNPLCFRCKCNGHVNDWVFPSLDELKRMADVEFTLKSHRVTLTIQEWEDAGNADPSYHLDEVWAHVTGVPHAWRHYLGFWALGSVIGATLDVDMFTYRVIRLLVGMMSREPLPLSIDIVFGRKRYDITFTVEDENFLPAAPLVILDDPRNDGGDGANKESGSEDKNPAHANKKQKHGMTQGASSSDSGSGVGGDIPMLGAAVSQVSEPGKGTTPFALKDLPMLQKIALTPMCNHSLARSRKDLKMQKQTADHPIAAGPILSDSESGAVGPAKATTGSKSASGNYHEAVQTSLSPKGAGLDALTVLDSPKMSDAPRKTIPLTNENGKGRKSSKWQEYQKPVVVRSSRLNSLLADGSVCADEDSTLKAMKKTSQRNLDGTLSGMKVDKKRLQPCSSPPARHIQPAE
ncbi:hypothetical protein U9M48_035684 [Paspalum notatum var. saurae]|uniref:DUF4283 domain-containing protein n=1 Tax=Paspalum notatum var. saurae TaxID=547442 RepID=A0AAQ3UDM3_PASNO